MNDPQGFTGNPRLDKLFGLPNTTVDVNAESNEPPKDPDVWESPSRELKTTRQQVFGVQLVKRDGTLLLLPYSAIDSGEGRFNGDRFTFRFFKGEAAFEATIQASIDWMQKVVDFLCAGKAERIRAGGEEIESVTWEAIPEKEE